MDGKVNIPYTFQQQVIDNYDGVKTPVDVSVYRDVELPLDLVVKIAKASIIDSDALRALEVQISSLAARTPYGTMPVVGQELQNKLNKAAQGVIDRPDDER